MPKRKTVTILKSGNILLLDPTDDRIFQLVKPLLSFTETVTLRGAEAYQRKRQGRSVYDLSLIHI